MIVKELKEICMLMNVNGLIDEFTIFGENVIGHDVAKTFGVKLNYKTDFIGKINISNISGILETLSKFPNESIIEISENRLKCVNGKRVANILLKSEIESILNLPEYKKEDFDIIVENIDNKILNNLSKLRSPSLMDEMYYLYIDNNKDLMMRVATETECNISDVIGPSIKNINGVIQFSMNISECFKNILTPTNIYIKLAKLMLVESKTDKYHIKYYLAPRVE